MPSVKRSEFDRIRIRAEETFGSPDRATLWLSRTTRALGGKSPMELLGSKSGARQVEDLLTRIDHGLGA
jgi:putative toxin-antitoxin system antitoxin component (TIGR02293 family)